MTTDPIKFSCSVLSPQEVKNIDKQNKEVTEEKGSPGGKFMEMPG